MSRHPSHAATPPAPRIVPTEELDLNGLLEFCHAFANDVAAGRTTITGDGKKTALEHVESLGLAAAKKDGPTALHHLVEIERESHKRLISIHGVHGAQSRVTQLNVAKNRLTALLRVRPAPSTSASRTATSEVEPLSV